jgi:hypothetical protein
MQNAILLNSGTSALRLRLQAPALTVGSAHVLGIAEEEGGIIRWRSHAAGVTLEAECRPFGAGEWRLTCSLRNEGADAEVRVSYPYLFYHFDPAQSVRVLNPTFGGVLESSTMPLCLHYPGPSTFCLTAVAGASHTLATGLFNREQRHVVIHHFPAGPDGQIRFVGERILVRQGTTVELPEQFIRIGADWGDACAPYRDFAITAFPRRRERPRWLTDGNFTETRKAHCLAPYYPPETVAGIWIFDDEGRPRTLADIKREVDEAMADGAEKGYTPLFYQFGWWKSMAHLRGLFPFDALCGDYTEAHGLTRDVIAHIHARGARTYLYTNIISVGDESDTFRRHPGLLVRDAAGFPQQNAGYPMYMLCHGAPEARDYWEKILQCILMELNADGLFLDQVGGGFPPCYCYAKEHRHEHPDTYGRDFIELVDFIGRRARELKPDCFIAGELVLDSRSPLLDETHGCGYVGITSKPPTDPLALRDTKPAEYYAFVRYLTPQIHSSISVRENLMNGAAGSHARPEWRAHRAVFESGLTPCVTEPAGAVAYLFGPAGNCAILAVRAAVEDTLVTVRLPHGLRAPAVPGGELMVKAGVAPVFVEIHTVE